MFFFYLSEQIDKYLSIGKDDHYITELIICKFL